MVVAQILPEKRVLAGNRSLRDQPRLRHLLRGDLRGAERAERIPVRVRLEIHRRAFFDAVRVAERRAGVDQHCAGGCVRLFSRPEILHVQLVRKRAARPFRQGVIFMRQHDVRDGYAALRTQLFQCLRVRFPGVVVRPVRVQEQVLRAEIVSAGLRRIRLRPPHAAHVPPARIHLKLRINPDQRLPHRKLVV